MTLAEQMTDALVAEGVPASDASLCAKTCAAIAEDRYPLLFVALGAAHTLVHAGDARGVIEWGAFVAAQGAVDAAMETL